MTRTKDRPALARAAALAPLLDSIGRELEERNGRLSAIEARLLGLLGVEGPLAEAERHALSAARSSERRELRRCHAELERLGCNVLGTTPLTVRVRARREGGGGHSTLWRAGRARR
jgi:hypothetical protein